MSDTIWVAIIGLLGTIITVVLVPLARFAWTQWKESRRAKAEATGEKERADSYRSEGTAVIEKLERENQELQLELEAAEQARAEARQIATSQAYSIEQLSDAKQRLANAYQKLAGGEAVQS